MDKVLTIGDLIHLSALHTAVYAGNPITYLTEDGQTRWGIARAFTRNGGGFLTGNEDVREAFVWLSGGSHFGEVWVPVSELVEGLRDGRVALDYRP